MLVPRLLTVIVLLLPIKMGLVLKAHVVPEEQASEMAPLKLADPLATIQKVVCVEPMMVGWVAVLLLQLVDKAVSVNAAAPMPVSDTTCGLPAALSLIVNEPVRVPLAVGEKDTLIAQLCPTPRVFCWAAQVFVWE